MREMEKDLLKVENIGCELELRFTTKNGITKGMSMQVLWALSKDDKAEIEDKSVVYYQTEKKETELFRVVPELDTNQVEVIAPHNNDMNQQIDLLHQGYKTVINIIKELGYTLLGSHDTGIAQEARLQKGAYYHVANLPDDNPKLKEFSEIFNVDVEYYQGVHNLLNENKVRQHADISSLHINMSCKTNEKTVLLDLIIKGYLHFVSQNNNQNHLLELCGMSKGRYTQYSTLVDTLGKGENKVFNHGAFPHPISEFYYYNKEQKEVNPSYALQRLKYINGKFVTEFRGMDNVLPNSKSKDLSESIEQQINNIPTIRNTLIIQATERFKNKKNEEKQQYYKKTQEIIQTY